MFYPEILERYEAILRGAEDFGEGDLSRGHLLDMIELLAGNDAMSLTRKHRWLGFIQGVMICRGLLTVLEERNATRNIFNGA